MFVTARPVETLLRGDGRGYNPREIRTRQLAGGYELITGVFRDDGPGSVPVRPDRPFHIVIPTGFDAWHSLHASVVEALQTSAGAITLDYM